MNDDAVLDGKVTDQKKVSLFGKKIDSSKQVVELSDAELGMVSGGLTCSPVCHPDAY